MVFFNCFCLKRINQRQTQTQAKTTKKTQKVSHIYPLDSIIFKITYFKRTKEMERRKNTVHVLGK